MRFSEAIRLGSMGTIQLYGKLKHHELRDNKFEVVGTCVIGAALHAIDADLPEAGVFARIGYYWPIANIQEWCPCQSRQSQECDVGHRHTAPLGAIVLRLNDVHHWNRERIAQWVEKMETVHPLYAGSKLIDERTHDDVTELATV